MRKTLIYFLSMMALWVAGSCNNTDTELYGHTSAVFRPFVDRMEKMDKDMVAMPSQYDADRDFAMMMKMHHQSAVDMANIELRQGTDTAIRETARKIIVDQQTEITRFDAFLQSGYSGMKTDSFAREAVKPIDATDMHMQSKQGDPDVAFATIMIPQHQGAIKMASIYLKYASDPQLKRTATAIIAAQQIEIQAFQRWLKFHDEHNL